MLSQRKISSFFGNVSKSAKGGMKRTAEISLEDACSSESLAKKPLTEANFDKKGAGDLLKLPHMKAVGLSTIGQSWFSALHAEFHKDYFDKLTQFVATERKSYTIYPPMEDVFSWSRFCKIKDVKVVILGQDPYHGPNQAHGLCFSVKKPVPPPPSLENMFKELTNDIAQFAHPGHGDLTGWAKQGVLLLNAVLTVRAHNANSHKGKGWEQFTDAVIKYINNHCAGVVFMLWGSYAQKKGSFIDKKRHHILRCVHPSPLSAYRGFFGCKHFSKANALLKEQGEKEIDWRAL